MPRPLTATIFADGPPCASALREQLRRGRFTVVLDGAAEATRREGWRPDLVLGDFDSVKPATLRYFERRQVPCLRTPDQDFTDLEKGLRWCLREGFRSLWVAQAFGGRLDHSFATLSLLRRYTPETRELLLFGEGERTRFVQDHALALEGPVGRRMAVLPFPRCRVTSRGLRYEMQGLALALGRKESVSNSSEKEKVRLEIQGAALVVEGLFGPSRTA